MREKKTTTTIKKKTTKVKSTTKSSSKSSKVVDLEVKDSSLIFNTVWNELVKEHDEKNLNFPTEIFWLNGAPGAGKGYQYALHHEVSRLY